MKKVIALLLAVLMLASLAACSSRSCRSIAVSFCRFLSEFATFCCFFARKVPRFVASLFSSIPVKPKASP